MKFNYKFQRLCGNYYGYPSTSLTGGPSTWKGSNIVYSDDGKKLVSAALNRVQIVDLTNASVRTIAVEARSNIVQLACSNTVLCVVDAQNYVLLIHLYRGVVLHRFQLSGNCRSVCFSTTGRYLAFGCGKHVEVWNTPSLCSNSTTVFASMSMHRRYTGLTDDVTCLAFSADESVLVAGSYDTTVRIWTLQTTKNFEPVTLSGHSSSIIGVYVVDDCSTNQIQTIYSVSADGSCVTSKCVYTPDQQIEIIDAVPQDEDDDEAVNFFAGGATLAKSTTPGLSDENSKSAAEQLVLARWKVKERRYFEKDPAVYVSTTSYCAASQLLAVGFTSGTFGIYEMPGLNNIHTLSVGTNQLVQTCILNKTGEWLALACPKSQQLLVWEWRSETYVLKQRGHAYGMKSMAYSPDGVCIATGGEDGKLKLWNVTSGFCYVTFTKNSHTAPVTAVTFATSSVVITASLDGTVKAHDLHRYRTFRTLTTPTPVQFTSLAVDPAGEIVVAGCTEPFNIYAWNLQTGKLLDVLSGHDGPVSSLAFQPSTGGVLVSSSWDGTIKTWDLYKNGSVPTESFQHSTDVVCVCYRPDGRQVCSGTIGGMLSFWNVDTGKLQYEIDGRNDIAGGRKLNDRMTSANNASSRYFTSISYTADGSCVLAGGNSKYVCIYEISQQMLLKKFQISHNRSLDGVLDELNSKNLGEAGPVDEEADPTDASTYGVMQLPGAKRGDDGSRTTRVEVRTMQVTISPTGREWALVSGEGLHVYSLDDDMIFDPISLTEAITPAAVESNLLSSDFSMALRMALHLNEYDLVQHVLEQTPFKSIPHVVRTVGPQQLVPLIQFLSKVMEGSPHVEFYLQWSLELLQTHGRYMDTHRSLFLRALRALHKIVMTKHVDLKTICNENQYTLDFIQDHAGLMMLKTQGAKRQKV